uniref:Uncharacterized protein n=1 Tax=Poecilia latipinna TaxID=48699 RepID=A0A3B3VTF0_9TELE
MLHLKNVSASFQYDSLTAKMFAIIEQWDEASNQYTDVTKKYFLILLVKFGLETAVFYSCSPKKYMYFLSVCSLSVLLADFLLTVLMGAAWFLGPEKSLVSTCFLLATASTTYRALPLPMLIVGFVDYCLDDVFMCNVSVSWKTFRNVILTLVVWAVAFHNSILSDYVRLVELDSSGEINVLLCKVTEPPLWFSITLGFILFWMPYLVMSVSCLICGVGVPAHLGVNLLWLECSNSLLVGLVFWAKSHTKGPYSSLPENMCLWQVYWHLSKDIRRSLPPTAVFNPSCEKKSSSLHV